MTIRLNTLRPPVQRLHTSDVAWLILISYVLGYNTLSREGDLLSEAVDRYLAAHRWPTEIALALFYIHLSNHVPGRYDPIHWLFLGVRGLCRNRHRSLEGEVINGR